MGRFVAIRHFGTTNQRERKSTEAATSVPDQIKPGTDKAGKTSQTAFDDLDVLDGDRQTPQPFNFAAVSIAPSKLSEVGEFAAVET
ncbi:MAG: hypothetical protein AAF539_05700 [Planctomycetota bacterium]